ncbi:hypothetical protein EDF68_103297 [Ochrobactrum sp. BH3]|nr:hypothetical protein EDF68_103297 [Ochrobactrum sp. BH3]
MSELLKRAGKVSVADWEAALAHQEQIVSGIIEDLQKKRDYINTPNLDPWFVQNAKPDIDRLEAHEAHHVKILAEIKEKLQQAKSARPSAIREQKQAYEERDELATEISKRLPILLAELTSLLSRAAKNDERLLKVAAAGEGEINSTSSWDKARGIERPLIVQGGTSAPQLVLHDLAGRQVWPVETSTVKRTAKDMPSHIIITNVGAQPITMLKGSQYASLPVGGTMEDCPSNCGVVGNPSALISVR